MALKGERNRESEFRPHEEGEDLWLVSYADMMTILVAFFVMMYSFSSVDTKKFEAVSADLRGSFSGKKSVAKTDAYIPDDIRQIRALQMLSSVLNLGENLEEAVKRIEDAVKASKSAENARKNIEEMLAVDSKKSFLAQLDEQTVMPELQMEMILPDSSLFLANNALFPEARIRLNQLAKELLAMGDIVDVDVASHTDLLSDGPSGDAQALTRTAIRAGAVAEALIAAGLPANLLKVRGMGRMMPLFPELNDRGRPIMGQGIKNRRIHIMLRRRPRLPKAPPPSEKSATAEGEEG